MSGVEGEEVKKAAEWIAPTISEGTYRTGLKMFNSLSKNEKVEFIPTKGRQVSWYICGPTVYDSAHLGHARNYITFDVLRRVLQDYFGYEVFYVMNVTDIDDKIIIRSHQTRLNKYLAVAKKLSGASVALPDSVLALLSEDSKIKDSKDVPLLLQTADEVQKVLQGLKENAALSDEDRELVSAAWDIQAEYLKLAHHFEQEFFEDLKLLGVRVPDAITRVSEYVEEVVTFIQKIIDNGFAYASEGDVYFDGANFSAAGYGYGKTSQISQQEQESLLAEGEGALSAQDAQSKKKRSSDFALWKASKVGEPSWDSPWGRGRPGWHIECSAMASDLLGSCVDINCGGTDLRFPHHDNQLAQSEAAFGCPQWVNYFLHSGHLHIDGLKMSKSLKNFITIRQSLRNYTARQLRLLILEHDYYKPLDIELVGSKPAAGSSSSSAAAKFESEVGKLHLLGAKIQLGDQTVADVLAPLAQWAVSTFGKEFQDLFIKKGRSIFEIVGQQAGANVETGTLQLVLHYQADGQKTERAYELSKDGELLENIDIWAGGRISQMEYIVISERTFADFFLNVRKVLRKQAVQIESNLKWNADDRKLHQTFLDTKDQVHQAFLDGINTPRVIELLKQIIGQVNLYITRPVDQQKSQVLIQIVKYVTHILRVFGLVDGDDDEDFGFPWEYSQRSSIEKPIGELLDVFCGLRDKVRDVARSSLKAKGKNLDAVKASLSAICNQNSVPSIDEPIAQRVHDAIGSFVSVISSQIDLFVANPQQLLDLTDKLRDDIVPFLGVRFEDEQDGTSSWKVDETRATLRDRETRKREVYAQEQRRLERERQKREREEQQRKKQEELEAKTKIPPADLFKVWKDYAGKFTAFDDNGFPTLDAEGKPVSKKSVKNLQKDFEAHKKLHAAYLAKNPSS
eukprot:TRINITY_DN2583_c0_g1_i1.p1 TRINITY_DN2583_c0_g1~~TRINITY_DN2583_c0_g1_i1.p1  ORF type:complete len:927 (+),score=491.36 TRINITY_DN2583_c0_g1_i1:55-2781(+)